MKKKKGTTKKASMTLEQKRRKIVRLHMKDLMKLRGGKAIIVIPSECKYDGIAASLSDPFSDN